MGTYPAALPALLRHELLQYGGDLRESRDTMSLPNMNVDAYRDALIVLGGRPTQFLRSRIFPPS
jgi:hypothetical protein